MSPAWSPWWGKPVLDLRGDLYGWVCEDVGEEVRMEVLGSDPGKPVELLE